MEVRICLLFCLFTAVLALDIRADVVGLQYSSRDTLALDPGQMVRATDDGPGQWKVRFLDDIVVNQQRERKPGTAVILSAVIPGAGQVYNGDYLKLSVIYGATGGLLYALDFNRHQYNRFQTAYELRLAGEEDEFAGLIPSARGIRNFRDRYRKDMELTYIGLGVTYLFNIIDAFVSAHLATFDIDDDLSFQLKPSVVPGLFNPTPTLGLVLVF